MTTTSPQPHIRKGLEVTTVFFASTTAALSAGIVAALWHAPALAIISAGGVTFGVVFGSGMTVVQYLNRSN
ncbi:MULTISPECIES: hypothetical protein [unclassified Streptomyces]|uniref:hypothetical protein n=1 Tax=unclassified Streptomyces TaxID=2593676 RepID=UPI000CD565F0|nr:MULTISPECIES: hypothetical protein [unclassified Streptomyces]AWL41033.1 hypothetical protein B9S64_25230 [Streptomyces sp. SM18]